MGDPATPAQRARLWPDGTTLVGMAWVFLTVYGSLAASESANPISAGGWLGTAVMLVVAWAVLDRRRWGRIAMMGIAAVTALAGVVAAIALSTHATELLGPALRGASFQIAVPQTPNDGIPYSIAVSILGFTSFGWMLRRDIAAEFGYRKKASTRAYQLGIGLVLLAVWVTGALGAAAHPMAHVIYTALQHARTL